LIGRFELVDGFRHLSSGAAVHLARCVGAVQKPLPGAQKCDADPAMNPTAKRTAVHERCLAAP
jgi:hypothetical protein